MSDHLVVICHGLWGQPVHVENIRKTLTDRHPNIHTLVSDSNQGNWTYDGIDVCGERCIKEIHDRMSELSEEGVKIKRISFVGYSLGGLIARYAIGALYSTNFFDTIEAVNFTTFATPHVGVKPTRTGALGWLFSQLGPRSLSVSGKHIFLADGSKKSKALLEVMSEPDSMFIKGLSLFQKRTIYANIINDRSVPFFTASISDSDPFIDLTKVRLRHHTDYPILLDSNEPYTMVKAGDKLEEIKKTKLDTREYIFRVIMIAGLPLWLLIFSSNAILQTYKSTQRITLHRSSNKSSHQSTLSTMTQDMVEEVIDQQDVDAEKGVLKLNGVQKRIVGNLNIGVKWDKYYVHCQRSGYAHAAIVARSVGSERLSEGLEVLGHWVDKVFLE